MRASEHVAQALIHPDAAANANYDHLLREQRHTEWNREVLAAARASCARELLTEVTRYTCATELDVPFSDSDANERGVELVDG